MKKRLKRLFVFVTFLIIVLITLLPEVSKSGVTRGLILSSTVIIPSLFPFMVCVLMIVKLGFYIKSKFINKVIYKLFGHNPNMFFAFVLSLIGGYPVGAKLISEMYKQKIISESAANIMLSYCVNAGPAFIIAVVGGAFGSKNVGIILLVSHVISSIFIALLGSKKIKKEITQCIKPIKKTIDFSSYIIESVKDATESILSICGFVILFSAIVSYFDYFFCNMTNISNISLLLEVTSAVFKTKNIYLVSFLLGFSGISIWFQIFAISKDFKINVLTFIFGRLLHGTISAFITKILFMTFKIRISTFNSGIKFRTEYLYSDFALFLSIGLMLLVLLIYLYTKNNSGKIIDDVL